MTKKGAHFRLKESVIEKIKVVADEKKMSQAGVIEFVMESYFADRSEEHKLLKETMSNLFDDKLMSIQKDLKRLRLTGNVVDRNVQMGMQFWNHYFLVNDFDKLGSTTLYKTDQFKEAEKFVQDGIENSRQRKLDWERKGSK